MRSPSQPFKDFSDAIKKTDDLQLFLRSNKESFAQVIKSALDFNLLLKDLSDEKKEILFAFVRRVARKRVSSQVEVFSGKETDTLANADFIKSATDFAIFLNALLPENALQFCYQLRNCFELGAILVDPEFDFFKLTDFNRLNLCHALIDCDQLESTTPDWNFLKRKALEQYFELNPPGRFSSWKDHRPKEFALLITHACQYTPSFFGNSTGRATLQGLIRMGLQREDLQKENNTEYCCFKILSYHYRVVSLLKDIAMR